MSNRSLIPADSIFDSRIFITVTLLVIQISLLAAIGVAGGGFPAADAQALVRFGALVKPLVWEEGQYWRLLTAMFLHSDVVHLLLNGVCLLYFGGHVEMSLGRARYLLLYFGSGLFAGLLSLAAGEPLAICVGSSGAIFGIVVAYLMVRVRGPVPWTLVMREPASRLLFFLIGLELAVGFLIPAIDSMAHLGGALTGVLLGYFLVGQWQPVEGASRLRPWLALALWLGGSAALVGQAANAPERPAYHVAAAIYYLDQNRARSLEHFERAVAKDAARAVAELDRLLPRSPIKALIIVTFLEWLDDGSAALGYYRDKVRRKPSPDDLWLLIALLERPDVANYPDALAACAEGRETFAGKMRWDLLEARIHAHFRKHDEALARLRETEKTSAPLTAAFWELTALCRLRRREWADAEQATSRCLAARPENLDEIPLRVGNRVVADWRYQCLGQLGRTSEALLLWSEMERQWRGEYVGDPDDPVAANNLAWFLATHPKPSLTVGLLHAQSAERADQADSTSGSIVNQLDEALRLVRQSVEAAPETYNLDTLAWVEHQRRDYSAAWAAMERALRNRHARQPDLDYHAAEILAALGRKSEAAEFLNRAFSPGVDFDEVDAAESLREKLMNEAGFGFQ